MLIINTNIHQTFNNITDKKSVQKQITTAARQIQNPSMIFHEIPPLRFSFPLYDTDLSISSHSIEISLRISVNFQFRIMEVAFDGRLLLCT